MEFTEPISERLQQGLALQRQGLIDAALAVFEEQLRLDGGSHQACYLLGRLWLGQKEWGRAADYFGRAIALKPDAAEYHGAMGDYWAGLGQSGSATNCYEAALGLDGSRATAGIRLNHGATLMDQGLVDQAITEFKKVVAFQPGWAAGWNNLGNALVRQGLYEGAIAAFEKVLAISDDIFETHANLAKLWNETGRHEQAVIHAERAISIHPQAAAAWFQRGWAEFELGRLETAEAALEECLRLAPRASGAFALLGQIAEQRGDLAQAQAAWLQCLAQQPRHSAVLGRVATRLAGQLPPGLQWQMEAMMSEPGLPDADREPLGYGLAHFYDFQQDYGKAVAMLDEACAARERLLAARSLVYDPQAFEIQVLKNHEKFKAVEMDSAAAARLAEMQSPTMVFVVGLPRSGTSLVEQVLATHPDVIGAGELTWIPDLAARLSQMSRVQSADLVEIKSSYLGQLRSHGFQSRVVVDKLPDNIYYLELIRRLFPGALVVRCSRGLRDLAISCRMTRFMSVRWNSRWENLAARFAFYERFVSQELAGFRDGMIKINYEGMVTNLDVTIAPVFERLGLTPPADCQAFHQNRRVVRTASAGQVRRPVYNSSVGRWRNYEFAYGGWFGKIDAIERNVSPNES